MRKIESVVAYQSITGGLHPTMEDAAKHSLMSLKGRHPSGNLAPMDWSSIQAILDNIDQVIEILSALKQQGVSNG